MSRHPEGRHDKRPKHRSEDHDNFRDHDDFPERVHAETLLRLARSCIRGNADSRSGTPPMPRRATAADAGDGGPSKRPLRHLAARAHDYRGADVTRIWPQPGALAAYFPRWENQRHPRCGPPRPGGPLGKAPKPKKVFAMPYELKMADHNYHAVVGVSETALAQIIGRTLATAYSLSNFLFLVHRALTPPDDPRLVIQIGAAQ
jgi:hypothetical protein